LLLVLLLLLLLLRSWLLSLLIEFIFRGENGSAHSSDARYR
jgi:hypothetical protein